MNSCWISSHWLEKFAFIKLHLVLVEQCDQPVGSKNRTFFLISCWEGKGTVFVCLFYLEFSHLEFFLDCTQVAALKLH